VFRFIGFVASVILAWITGSAIATGVNSAIAGGVLGFIVWIVLALILVGVGSFIDTLLDYAGTPDYGSVRPYTGTSLTFRERMERNFGKRSSRSKSAQAIRTEDFSSFLSGERAKKK